MGALAPGDYLTAASTLLVGAVGIGVGLAVRRGRSTVDAIEHVRHETDEDVTALRADVSAIRTDVSQVRSDLAEVRGYLAAVQGDHFAMRRQPDRLPGWAPTQAPSDRS